MNARFKIRCLLGFLLITTLGANAQEVDFYEEIERIDEALRTNPSGVLYQSLESCRNQRKQAISLYQMGMDARARRALKYCYSSLMIPETATTVTVTAPTEAELLAEAEAEYEKALALTPDVTNGLAVYRECAACHEPEGWGRTTGSIPQIAGQHRTVIIKQLVDFRAGNRDSALMTPYASPEVIGGAQAIADVAAYIASLEMSVENGKGESERLPIGEALYERHCVACHGVSGEGDEASAIPRIQAQHYKYLLRQFEWIKSGKRRNADSKMIDEIYNLEEREVQALADYVSRLQPPEELQAPADWKNPDFN